MSLRRFYLAMITLAAALFAVACAQTQEAQQPAAAAVAGEWITLFDGSNLDGWTMAGPGSFELEEDGTMRSVGGMGLFFFEEETFRDYVLELDWKAESRAANSGVFLRFPEASDDPWHAVEEGYEIQINDSSDPIHKTGSIYSFAAPFKLASKEPGEWNTFRIKVTGQRYEVYLNGEKVNDYFGDRGREGYVGVQNHDDESTVWFRNIRVQSLHEADYPESRDELAASERDDPFRAMSFNIRLDTPADGPDAWPHRKDMVASMVRFHHADIVGTQEGFIHQLEDIESALQDYRWVGVGRDAGDDKGEFCAIFYRTTRFESLNDGTFWLSETPEEPSMGWDADFPRIVTWVQLRDWQSGHVFYVFNTHFDHRGEEARIESSHLILQKVDEIAGREPVILMGDLNVTEEQEAYKVLAEYDRGPVQLALSDGFYTSRYGHHGPTSTWNGFERIFPDRRIDYIFVDNYFSVIQHGILADIRDGHFPSDHLPVLAEIEFR